MRLVTYLDGRGCVADCRDDTRGTALVVEAVARAAELLMPHDRNGKKLEVGDRVIIEAVVTNISEGEQYCNCSVNTVLPMPPYEDGTSITLNTQQVEKLPSASAPATANSKPAAQ